MTSISRAKLKSVGNHDEFLNRITKSLYYTKLPMRDCLSLPVTELAAEFFTEVKSGHTLERLDMEEASKISRNACVSPCSLVLALLYLERLKDCNPEYLQKVAPSELFLVSLMVASKFLNDDGEEDEVFNTEWAQSGDLTISHMNQLEKDFLKAINWSVFVRNQDFWDRLHRLERDIAYKEGQKRGWFSYTELSCLINSTQLAEIAHALINVSSICLATYAAGVATLLGSALVASYLPGSIMTSRQTGDAVNSEHIVSRDIVNEIIASYNSNGSTIVTGVYNVSESIKNTYDINESNYDIGKSVRNASIANNIVWDGYNMSTDGHSLSEKCKNGYNVNRTITNGCGLNKTRLYANFVNRTIWNECNIDRSKYNTNKHITHPNIVNRIVMNECADSKNTGYASTASIIIKRDIISEDNGNGNIANGCKRNGIVARGNITDGTTITWTVSNRHKQNLATTSWTSTSKYIHNKTTIRNRTTTASKSYLSEVVNDVNSIISLSNFETTPECLYQSSMVCNKSSNFGELYNNLNELFTELSHSELEVKNLKSNINLDWKRWLNSATTWLRESSTLKERTAAAKTITAKTGNIVTIKAPNAVRNTKIGSVKPPDKQKSIGAMKSVTKTKAIEAAAAAESRKTEITKIKTRGTIAEIRSAEKDAETKTMSQHKYFSDPFLIENDADLMARFKWCEMFGINLKLLLQDWRYYLAKIVVGSH